MAETADLAKEILGDKLYQKRARQALPILVRQAEAKAPIKYEDLAAELQMPNPRNLNICSVMSGRFWGRYRKNGAPLFHTFNLS